jgi:hypothetical protein
MLYQPERHEPLAPRDWDPSIARAAIDSIIDDTQLRFSARGYWPLHPKDIEPGDDVTQPAYPLYFGAAGVIWALRYLQDVGASAAAERYGGDLESLSARNRAWLAGTPGDQSAAYLMGDTPIALMRFAESPMSECAERLARLIASNEDHPSRELMWGAPGTMLAALFLWERSSDARWAELFRCSAERLWSQLLWSEEHTCHYWTQDLYGRQSTYLDAVHGFVATAHILTRGRALLGPESWAQWEHVITNTIARSATREANMVSWRTQLGDTNERPRLMQFCHGAPGFVICLAAFPGSALEELLIGAGEAVWAAGPLRKGSNLCHGTGGNGYALLKLYDRTRDARWLARARAFAMHGIEQTERDRERYGQSRYSLWTGDLGFAIFLWDCIRAEGAFPTLEVFYGATNSGGSDAAHS